MGSRDVCTETPGDHFQCLRGKTTPAAAGPWKGEYNFDQIQGRSGLNSARVTWPMELQGALGSCQVMRNPIHPIIMEERHPAALLTLALGGHSTPPQTDFRPNPSGQCVATVDRCKRLIAGDLGCSCSTRPQRSRAPWKNRSSRPVLGTQRKIYLPAPQVRDYLLRLTMCYPRKLNSRP
jgi:hypothetical protein